MSDETSQRDRKWRGADTGGREGRAAGSRAWRKQSPRNAGEPVVGRRLRVWLRRFATLSACVLALVLLITMPTWIGCQQTHLIVVTESDYADPAFAPNLYAPGTAADLQALDGTGELTAEPAVLSRDQSSGDISLGNPLKHAREKDVVVIYLSLHGSSRGEGGALPRTWLVTGNSDADQLDRTAIDLNDLWAGLKRLKPTQHKLVLLDLNAQETAWRAGQFDTVDLQQLESAVGEVENLVVITSCSPGERSWGSADLGGTGRGQTAFGAFITEALSGRAGGTGSAAQPDADGNGIVSVIELFDYVHARTRSWVAQNRDLDGQHPLIIPARSSVAATEALNFSVVSLPYRRRSAPVEEGNSTPADANPDRLCDRLEQAWDRCQALRRADRPNLAALQLDPLRWHAAVQQLRRAESWLTVNSVAQAERELANADANLRFLEELVSKGPVPKLKEDAPFAWQHIYGRIGAPRKCDDPDQRLDDEETSGSNPGPSEVLDRWLETHLPEVSRPMAEKARTVRCLAENAACAPPGTLDAVAPLLREADRQRREGEDLLFAGQPDQAQNALAGAEQTYQEAFRIAATLHEARSLRNWFLADLHYWAELAGSRSVLQDADGEHMRRVLNVYRNERPQREDIEVRIDVGKQRPPVQIDSKLLVLFELARKLSQQLDAAGEVRSGSDVDPIAETLAEVEETRQALDATFAACLAEARQSGASDKPQWVDWRMIDDLLKFPFLPGRSLGQTRRELHAMLARHSRNMQRAVEQKNPGGRKTAAAPPRADWNAFWALQVVSFAAPQAKRVGDIQTEWERSPARSDAQSPFVALGEEVRAVWEGFRSELEGSRPDLSSSDLATLGKRLDYNDRLSRMLHPRDAEQLAGRYEDALVLQRFRLEELFLAQARRCLDDYWHGWYDQAAEECLQAVRLVGHECFKGAVEEATTSLEERRRGELTVETEARLRLGHQSSRELPVRVVGTGDVPEGFAAVWLELEKSPLVRTSALRQAARVPKPDANALALRVERVGEPDAGDCTLEIPAYPRLFFRGHGADDRNQSLVKIDPCPPVGTTLTYTPPPPNGTVKVVGIDRRPILFILDCSDSMKHNNRFTKARDTLKATLNDLRAKGQDGTPYRVGLIAYGHRVRELTTDNGVPRYREERFRSVGGPRDDIEVLHKIQPLSDAAHAAIVETHLKNLGWYGNTPLLGALMRACREFDRDSGGIIVAITDGLYMDADRLDAVRTEVKQHPLIDLHVVAFDLQSESQKAALKKLATQDTRGEFYDAPSADELKASLDRAIRTRQYTVSGGSPPRVNKSFPFGVTSDPLDPGRYTLRVERSPEVSVDLQGGDALEFHLGENGVRRLLPERFRFGESSRASEGWLGCKVAKVDGNTRTAEFVLSLVRPETSRSGRPEEIRFDVLPQGETGPLSTEYGISRDSVPTWKVLVQGWPERRPADVRVVWKDKRTPADRQIRWDELNAGQPLEIRLKGVSEPLKVTGRVLRDRNQVEIRVEPSAGPDAPQPTGLLDQLSRLRVELARGGLVGRRYEPQDLRCTQESFADGLIVYTFDVSEFDPQTWVVDLTSWESRQQGSATLQMEVQPE